MELKKPPYRGHFSFVCLICAITVKKRIMEIILRTIGKIGNNSSGTPIRREAIICQKVIPSIPTISTKILITIANLVPREVNILRSALLYPDSISPHDRPRVASRLILPTAVSVENLYRINSFEVIIIKALIYSIRIAGTRVILATRTEDIGAKSADRLPAMITQEYICVILSFGASSTSRQSHDTVVIFIIPLSIAAATKNQKPWLKAHMMQGRLQARKSNTIVLFLRPNLSMIAPDKNAQIICENI
jgi:hypothetical protein